MRLRDKVAIITGGGTGIGRGIAQSFAHEGAKLVLAQPSLEQAEPARAELQEMGSEVEILACDVSSRNQVKDLIRKTLDRFGVIDILVNNAAITGHSALHKFFDCTDEVWDRILSVNLKGPFLCSQEVARHMLSRKTGVILNISSIAAFAAQEMATAYCASKSGLEGLTKSTALELAPYGIRVNAIAPGEIVVEHDQETIRKRSEQSANPAYLRKTPLGRRGLPSDIGAAAVFLASDDAGFVSGTTLLVDGGLLTY